MHRKKIIRVTIGERERFENVLRKDPKIKKYLSKNDLNKLLNTEEKIKHIDRIFKKVFEV